MKNIINFFSVFFFLIFVSFNGYSESFYYKIPEKYQDLILVEHPKQNFLVKRDLIKVKGKAKQGVQVFIEGNNVLVNEFGEFIYFLPVSLGKQSIKIDVVSDKASFSLIRNGIGLRNPNNLMLSNQALALINTKFISKGMKQSDYSNFLKREELGYFLNKIRVVSPKKSLVINDLDQISYRDDIQEIVNASVLSLDKRGSFFPKSKVNRIIFTAAVSKALNYSPSNRKYVILDKFKKKWFHKYLVIGFDKGLLDENDLIVLSKPLTNADFLTYASKVPVVFEDVEAVLTFDDIHEEPKVNANQGGVESPVLVVKKDIQVLKVVDLKSKQRDNQPYFDVLKVVPQKTHFKIVKGKVFPAKPFVANWTKVSVDSNGNFSFKVPKHVMHLQINFGNHQIIKELKEFEHEVSDFNRSDVQFSSIEKKEFQVENKSFVVETTSEKNQENESLKLAASKQDGRKIQVTQLKPYLDLNGHWIEPIANQLKIEKKLDNTDNFEPSKYVSRSELAKYLSKINDLGSVTTDMSSKMVFDDVDKADVNYPYIKLVVSNKLLKGASKNKFFPTKDVSRLEAIVVASRLLPDSDEYRNIELPYSDIKKYSWADNALKKAYHHNIISKSEKFFPKRKLTNAEVVSILYKVSQI